MDNKYLISVIIPVFNVQDYIEECLSSIVHQSIGFERIQVVLVNDGSTDNSQTICRSFVDKFPDNVIYVEQDNAGVSAARNRGLSLANAELVTFLDADDKWSYDAFKLTYAESLKHPEVCVFSCRMNFFGTAKGGHQLNYKYKENRIVDIRKDYDCPQLSSSSVFIRLEIAQKYKYKERLKYSEDFRFINEILLDYPYMMLLKDPIYWYRRRSSDDSAMQTSVKDSDYYIPTCKYVYKYLFDLCKNKYGNVLKYVQFCVMYDLRWRLKIPLADSGLNSDESEQYLQVIVALLKDIDDEIILEQRRIALALQLFALDLKYNESQNDYISSDASGNIKYKQFNLFSMTNQPVLTISSVEIEDKKLSLTGQANLPFEDNRFTLYYALTSCVDDYSSCVLEMPKLHKIDIADGTQNAKTYLFGKLKANHLFRLEENIDLDHESKMSFFIAFDDKPFITKCLFRTGTFLDRKSGIYKAGLKAVCRRDSSLIISRLSLLQYSKQLFRVIMAQVFH